MSAREAVAESPISIATGRENKRQIRFARMTREIGIARCIEKSGEGSYHRFDVSSLIKERGSAWNYSAFLITLSPAPFVRRQRNYVMITRPDLQLPPIESAFT